MMNVFKNLTKIQTYFSIILIFGFLLKYNFFVLYIFQVPSITGLIFKNLLIILILYWLIVPVIQNKKARLILLLLLLFFTIFILSNLWYNRYFGNYLSLSDILMGTGFRPFEVLLRQLISIYDLFFVFDIFILFYFLIKEKLTTDIKYILSYNFRTYVIILGLIIIIFPIQLTLTNSILGDKSPMLLFNTNTSAFVNVYGFAALYVFEYKTLFHSNKVETIETKPPKIDKKLTNAQIVADDHNIIVIQVESLDQKIIDYKHNGKEVTPFLNNLKENSLYFNNFYAQHVNGSFDAEFSFLTSTYPINKNFGFKVNDLSNFKSLVKILKNNNYYTLAFHGNDKEFFYRHKAYPELGFDRFYSKKDFSFTECTMDIHETKFGINDFDFFLQSFEHLKEANRPFFAFLITVSSHTPFNFYPPSEARDEFEDINDTLVRNYFNSISFVDKSLKIFFDSLYAHGLDENSLIIIYSDHESGIEKKEYSSHRKFVLNRNLKEPENIPLFIIHPDIDPGLMDKEATPTDLAPTILDILGEQKIPKEFLGHSLFDQDKFPVLFIHEIPQILYNGQLYVSLLDSIEKVGYVKNIGEQNLELPEQEELLKTIEFMKGITLERRADP